MWISCCSTSTRITSLRGGRARDGGRAGDRDRLRFRRGHDYGRYDYDYGRYDYGRYDYGRYDYGRYDYGRHNYGCGRHDYGCGRRTGSVGSRRRAGR